MGLTQTERARELRVTDKQRETLGELTRGPITVSEIIERARAEGRTSYWNVRITHDELWAALRRLEKRGMVTRGPKRRGGAKVSLTAKGKAALR